MLERTSLYSCLALLMTVSLVSGCDDEEETPDPCDTVTCNDPPPPACDGTEVVTFAQEGTCSEGECEYEEFSREECYIAAGTACDEDEEVSFGEGYCENAECVLPELGRQSCDEPPAQYCDGDEEVRFAETGQCEEGGCVYPEITRILCENISMFCDAAEGRCVDRCEDVSCPPQDMWCEDGVAWMLIGYCDWQTGECIYEETETDLPDCGFGYNFDFEIWADGLPEGFMSDGDAGFRVMEDGATVNTGQRAARLESDTTESRTFMSTMPFEYVQENETYTVHLWYRFDGRPEGGSSASLRPVIEIADAEGDASGPWTMVGPEITEASNEWRELTFTTNRQIGADRTTLRPMLRMRGESGTTVTAHVDDWAVTIPHTRNLNSRRDLDSLLFLFNGNYWVASGIDNAGLIYPSARSAEPEEGWDQMLFTWVGEPSNDLVDAPWEKSGQVAGPGAGGVLFALLQDTTGHCEWQRFDPASDSWSVVGSHVACSDREGDPVGLNYALEGTLDLVAHLDGVDRPEDVPSWFHFAASHWETGEGGELIEESQTPASVTSGGHIEADETHRAHRASFLSGKVDYYFP